MARYTDTVLRTKIDFLIPRVIDPHSQLTPRESLLVPVAAWFQFLMVCSLGEMADGLMGGIGDSLVGSLSFRHSPWRGIMIRPLSLGWGVTTR